MALLGNYSVLLKCPGRFYGGSSVAGAAIAQARANFNTPGSAGGCCGVEDLGFLDQTAVPDGYRPPYCWQVAQRDGAMASHRQALGAGAVAGNLAGGLYGASSITAGGAISNADMRLLILAAANIAAGGTVTASIRGAVQMLASITAGGAISNANLNSVVAIVASLSGSGAVSASIAGVLNAAASLVGSGAITDANLGGVLLAACAIGGGGTLTADVIGAMILSSNITSGGSLVAGIKAIGHAVSGIVGAGNVTAATTAHASMSADITSVSELSPQSLAAAVWNSLVTSFQDAGTMGEAMATAGSGGLSPTQVTMLTELYRLAGLDTTRPLVVTATTRDAGAEIEQTIAEAPAGTVTVTRV